MIVIQEALRKTKDDRKKHVEVGIKRIAKYGAPITGVLSDMWELGFRACFALLHDETKMRKRERK